MSITRRRFVQGTLTAAGAIAVPMLVSSRVFGANDEIRIGVVGCGGRGRGAHIPSWQRQEGVSVVAVSDSDEQRRGVCAEIVAKNTKQKVEQYTDMRKMFERKDIDAISNATQNYWHGLSTIWACQAGKHVYVEKPLSHYIWEGRQMVRAARKYDRLVQCGTQRRSQPSIGKMGKWLREGHLGKILYITTFANKPRTSCGKRDTPLEIPDHIDYDTWCGPAKKLPIYRDRLQYDCSFDWNTGDGESCNQGIHEVDVARWILGEEALPRRVMSIGGRFLFNDACDVPNTQIIYYDFPTAPVLYEVHNLRRAKGTNEMNTFRGERTGVVVNCEGGTASAFRGVALDNDGKVVKQFSGGGSPFVNFIEALRSGKREDLNSDVEVGHVSTAVCHTGNISYRLGKAASVAEQRKQVEDIPFFNEMHSRYLDHLKANEIDPDTSTLGPWLEVDQENERFKDSPKANELAHGYYREPFSLPEIS